MEKIEINTFIERDRIGEVYEEMFGPDNESNIEILFSLIYNYDVMKPKKLKKLQNTIYKLEKILRNAIHEFELEELNYIKKQNNGRTKHRTTNNKSIEDRERHVEKAIPGVKKEM